MEGPESVVYPCPKNEAVEMALLFLGNSLLDAPWLA